MLSTLQAQIPEKLSRQIAMLVEDGWYADTNSVVTEALRHFLDTHTPELMEKFIKNDVDWGLHGSG